MNDPQNFKLTSNEEVMAWDIGFDMALYRGYVTKWDIGRASHGSSSGAPVARMVLSNNTGTKLQ